MMDGKGNSKPLLTWPEMLQRYTEVMAKEGFIIVSRGEDNLVLQVKDHPEERQRVTYQEIRGLFGQR